MKNPRVQIENDAPAAPEHRSMQIILALVVGTLITWGITYIISNDLLHRWSRMPDLPGADTTLVAIRGFTVYAQRPDGQLLAIEPAEQTVWQPVASIPTDADKPQDQMRLDYLGACNRHAQRFSAIAAVPQDEQQCLEAVTAFGPSAIILSVIRDSHDQLWYFQIDGPDFNPAGQFIGPCLFVLASFFSYPLIRAIFMLMRRVR